MSRALGIQIRDDEWQVGCLRFQTQIGLSPPILLCASRELGIPLQPEMLDEDDDAGACAAELVDEVMSHPEILAGPTLIRTTEPGAVDLLRQFVPKEVRVELVESAQSLDMLVAFAQTMLETPVPRPPGFGLSLPSVFGPRPICSHDVTEADLRAFAIAGRDFFARRPWEDVDFDVLFRIRRRAPKQKPMTGMHYFSLMGQSGQEFGLSFYKSQQAFADLLDEQPGAIPTWGVTFDPIDEMRPGDALYWEKWHLPVAETDAHPDLGRRFPSPLGYTDDGHVVRPTSRRLQHLATLLATLATADAATLQAGHLATDAIEIERV